MLRRRVLWLRKRWGEDPLQGYGGVVVSDARATALLGDDGPEAEARFHAEDPEAAAVSRSIAELEGGLAAASISSIPPAAEAIGRLFGLDSFERDVLLLALAPEVDPDISPLYAYVQDDARKPFATPHLALTLFATERSAAELRQYFLPDAPLRRFRLVAPDPMSGGSLGSRPLLLDGRVADYLMGTDRLDDRVSRVTEPLRPAPLAPAHIALVERLKAWSESRSTNFEWPVLNLIGRRGSGLRSVVEAFCHGAGISPHLVSLDRLPELGPDLDDLIPLMAREATLLQLAYVFDVRSAEGSHAAVRDLVARLPGPVLVVSERPWKTDCQRVAVTAPSLTAADKVAMWHGALDGVPNSLNGDVGAIVQQFEPGPAAIAGAVQLASSRLDDRTGRVLSFDDLWDACREYGAEELQELAQRIVPASSWEDIVLPEDALWQLREIAGQVANRPSVYEAWGFGRSLSRGRGVSVLFSGPSGTGKTMAAEVLAEHFRLELYRIDLAGVVSKYIGETEKNLRRVFDAAERSGAILFFDEADALFGKRSEVRDSHDRYANIEIDYLLQRMDDYRGVAILATNQKSLLDPAFLRRLRFLVDFPFPHAALRRRIWERAFPSDAPIDGVDYEVLAGLEIAGGNIRNIALAAAFLAADEGRAIGMPHVIHAARREFTKIDRILPDAVLGGLT